MKNESKSLESTFARLAAAHLLNVMFFALLFRLYLAVGRMHADIPAFVYSFARGAVFDIAVAVYSFPPFLVFLFLPITRRRIGILLGLDTFFFLFVFVSELFFYEEFKDRFNFIAVDYLVYTHEVLRNIWESYPVLPVLFAAAVVAGLAAHFLTRTLFAQEPDCAFGWRARAGVGGLCAAAFALCFFALTEQGFLSQANFSEELMAKNGVHALFAAYRNNEIKFDRFYTTMDSGRAVSFVHAVLESNHQLEDGGEEEASIVRNVREPLPMLRKNVVLVIMESLSAKFMKSYGNPQNLTPNLDRLAGEGLFFDRIYATGTRTVRGLEAIILSIPPTPGQSIVRRPAGIGIFNMGTVFRDFGYDTNFIYGGRALFDNMGAFFAGNGFAVRDQSSFPGEEISFTNAWGVSDEDLFRQVLKASDESVAAGRKFFHAVLTTSNHRPYTYPAGRVAIPSGKGRDGAVQYSDYAIGKFIEDAKSREWFNDTIFVFVADHNASVAGQSKIDPNDYLVPMIFYAPGTIKPEVIHHMGSQIDLAPTLLETLQASYQSRFFGMELQDDNPARAFLGTYQSVAYLDEDSLTILSPNRKLERYSWDGKNLGLLSSRHFESLPEHGAEEYLPAVAYYKTASDWFGLRLLDDKKRFAKSINTRD